MASPATSGFRLPAFKSQPLSLLCYVVPANALSADQSRFLDDTRQDCGRGVAWAEALDRFVGPFPGCFPCRLTCQESG